jgi:hypothetical protein
LLLAEIPGEPDLRAQYTLIDNPARLQNGQPVLAVFP